MKTEISGIAVPTKSFVATFAVIPTTSGATQISIEMNYETKLIFGGCREFVGHQGQDDQAPERSLSVAVNLKGFGG